MRRRSEAGCLIPLKNMRQAKIRVATSRLNHGLTLVFASFGSPYFFFLKLPCLVTQINVAHDTGQPLQQRFDRKSRDDYNVCK